jgi:hypothetical protein
MINIENSTNTLQTKFLGGVHDKGCGVVSRILMLTRTVGKERITIRVTGMQVRNIQPGKLLPGKVEACTMCLCGGGAKDVVSQGRMDASSVMSARKVYSAHTSVIDEG